MLSLEEVLSAGRRTCPYERMYSKYVIAPSGCWEYTGGRDAYGYGRFSVGGRQLGAHKVSYVLSVEDVGRDQVVMHSCDNPCCINPEHLSTGTVKQNVHDCIDKNRFSYFDHRTPGSGKIIFAHNAEEMLVFSDIRKAEKNGFSNPSIYNCINGKLKTHRGYKWYAESRS